MANRVPGGRAAFQTLLATSVLFFSQGSSAAVTPQQAPQTAVQVAPDASATPVAVGDFPPARVMAAADEPPAMDPAKLTVTIHSPFKSATRARVLLNTIAIDLVTQLGYVESIPRKGESRTAGMAGIGDQRFFVSRKSAGNERRIMELELIQNASGKFDAILFGLVRNGESETANSDLMAFLPTVKRLFNEAEGAEGVVAPVTVAHHLFQLSYIQADEAMGILKALGYSTIEFNKLPGATIWENNYEPVRRGEIPLPVIIKFIDGSKRSLMEPAEGTVLPTENSGRRGAIPDIGGTFLHHMTSGEPEQRLLILYNEEHPEAVESLVNVLRETIDVPARQVVISALVVEINSNRSKELGLTFSGGNGRNSGTFQTDPVTGEQRPFTFTFDSGAPRTAFNFQATLSALIQKGEAEILSNPSVLVLDGRQARIQIGKQVPVVNSTSTAAGITSSVEYFPVGIVLNLRPRINEPGTEVTMQVETIVSALVQSTAGSGSQVFFAPTIDNRQVQTFVRVADNTPFIIGGLISADKRDARSGVPLLSEIPWVGAMFRTSTKSQSKKEVIVVLTPHIIPTDDPSFTYVLPRDSALTSSSDNQLFRNTYRIRGEDVHDLRFVDDSEVFQTLLARVRSQAAREPSMRTTEPFASLLKGRIPGEEVLVHRMLWEIINRSGISKSIDLSRVTLFQSSQGGGGRGVGQLSEAIARMNAQQNALIMSFAASVGTTEHPFAQPKASVSYEHVAPGEAEQLLLDRNRRRANGVPEQWSIVLSPDSYGAVPALDVLRDVLVLKKVLAVNKGVDMTLANFHVGRRFILPPEQDIKEAYHVIDRETAQLFFEVVEHYLAFETEFNAKTREAFRAMSIETKP